MASHMASDEQGTAAASLDEANRVPLQLRNTQTKLAKGNRTIGGMRKTIPVSNEGPICESGWNHVDAVQAPSAVDQSQHNVTFFYVYVGCDVPPAPAIFHW